MIKRDTIYVTLFDFCVSFSVGLLMNLKQSCLKARNCRYKH